MPAQIDIVIVNWNAGDLLRDCIQSVLDSAKDEVRRIIVVDNGSIDNSLKGIPLDPRIIVDETGKNLGFGRACNRGAKLGVSRYILFLNPDTRLYASTLADVLRFMETEANSRVGVCGIRLIQDDGTIQHHTTSLPTPMNIYRVDSFRTPFDHASNRPVSHVIGAFYFLRRSLFENLGGFDERFFVYFEDLDLSHRVHCAGWSIHYLASAAAYHKGGGTSEGVKAKRLCYSLSSRLRYSRKHFSALGYALVVAVTFGVEPLLRGARALRHRSITEMREILVAYRMLLDRKSRR